MSRKIAWLRLQFVMQHGASKELWIMPWSQMQLQELKEIQEVNVWNCV